MSGVFKHNILFSLNVFTASIMFQIQTDEADTIFTLGVTGITYIQNFLGKKKHVFNQNLLPKV